MSTKELMIERWRFDQLRLAVASALDGASSLVFDLEKGGQELDGEERYHITVSVMAILANGLQRVTEP